MNNKLEVLKENLSEMFKFLDIDPDVEIIQGEDSIDVVIEGRDLSFLIGYRGDVLSSLEYFLNLSLFRKTDEWTRVNVDINSYKDQKKDKLEEVTKRSIDRVRFFDEDVEMPPMSPADRRVVHMFVSEYDDILSESAGEGRNRHVVLKKKL